MQLQTCSSRIPKSLTSSVLLGRRPLSYGKRTLYLRFLFRTKRLSTIPDARVAAYAMMARMAQYPEEQPSILKAIQDLTALHTNGILYGDTVKRFWGYKGPVSNSFLTQPYGLWCK